MGKEESATPKVDMAVEDAIDEETAPVESTRILHPTQIQDGVTRESIAAVVIEGISEQEAEDVDRTWQPALFDLLGRVAREQPDEFDVPEHIHWNGAERLPRCKLPEPSLSFLPSNAGMKRRG